MILRDDFEVERMFGDISKPYKDGGVGVIVAPVTLRFKPSTSCFTITFKYKIVNRTGDVVGWEQEEGDKVP